MHDAMHMLKEMQGDVGWNPLTLLWHAGAPTGSGGYLSGWGPTPEDAIADVHRRWVEAGSTRPPELTEEEKRRRRDDYRRRIEAENA